jgi:hypothetical protein
MRKILNKIGSVAGARVFRPKSKNREQVRAIMAVEKADTALSSLLVPSYVQYEVVVSPKNNNMLTIT